MCRETIGWSVYIQYPLISCEALRIAVKSHFSVAGNHGWNSNGLPSEHIVEHYRTTERKKTFLQWNFISNMRLLINLPRSDMLAEDLYGFFQTLQVKAWLGTSNFGQVLSLLYAFCYIIYSSSYYWMIYMHTHTHTHTHTLSQTLKASLTLWQLRPI